MKGIDHLVLCVADLDAARGRYQAMGFTMTPKAQHPFGTGNSNIQLDGCFLEVLTVMAPEDIFDHAPGRFSFGAHNRDYLAESEGFSMLVLDSDDARADQRQFAAAGLTTYEPFDFSRTAKLPSGEEVTVGFSLAFATDPLCPRNAFFTCQQHAPKHFWKPEFQTHANTAHTISEIVLVSEKPQDHAGFLQGYTGHTADISNPGSLELATARGVIRVVEPQACADLYHTDPVPGLAAYCIGVDDLAATRKCLETSGIPCENRNDRLVLPARETFGVAVAFEQRSR